MTREAWIGRTLGFSGCCLCRQPFTFNPDRVPCLDGRPFCPDCLELLNKARARYGLDPIEALPGAYDPAEA